MLRKAIEKGVGFKLKLSLTNIIFHHPCLIFDKDYLLNYFIQLRIRGAIKFLNRHFISEKKAKNKTGYIKIFINIYNILIYIKKKKKDYYI